MSVAPVNLSQLLEGAALRHRDRPCLSWEGGAATYLELAAAVAAQADALAGAGLAARRVGLMARNRPELVVLWLACMKAGTTAVFLNPQLTETEVRGVVDDLALAAVVGDRDLDPGTSHLVLPETEGTAAVALPGPAAEAAEAVEAATVVLTSGSTGRSKYVPVPHLAYALKATLNVAALGWNASDRTDCVMPLFHVGAQCETLAPALAVGAAVHLSASFSASGLWTGLEQRGTSHFHATGSLLAMALARGEPSGPSPLRRIVGSLRADLGEALGEVFPQADLISVYGLTECPLGTLSALGEPYRPGWVGYPYLGGSLRLQEGEIQLRNGACTAGYIGLPAGEGFTEDGWLRTGDLGEHADGGLYLTGRTKEMIRRSGENIAPAEVEEAALRHPGVVEAAALPYADPIRDEEVWLLVEAKGEGAPTPAELREFVSARLAPFKRPRYIDILADLPMTGSNKVDKPALRARQQRPAWDAQSAARR
ncbi:MAG: class I adenylate-forming enzyme family protein [Solirubrobacterales bacterium]